MKICELNCYQEIASQICLQRCVITCVKKLKFNCCGKPRKKPVKFREFKIKKSKFSRKKMNRSLSNLGGVK